MNQAAIQIKKTVTTYKHNKVFVF